MIGRENAVENPLGLGAANEAKFSEVSQVAWLRVGALGDLLVSLACLRETLEKFPHAKVWVVGPKLWLELIQPTLWPRVNGIITLNKNKGLLHELKDGKWVPVGEAQPLKSFFTKCQAYVNLRVESYRYAWPAFFAGVKYRFGTCPPSMKWLYSYWSPWLGKDPIIHERDRMLEILEAPKTKLFSIQTTKSNRALLKEKQTGSQEKKPDKYQVFQPNQDAKSLTAKWRDKALPQIVLANPQKLRERFGLKPNEYWLVNPTSSRWEKAWSPKKFREFSLWASESAKRNNKQLIVVGSPSETEWLQSVAGSDVRIVQPQSLQDLSNLVCLAELLVTNTSSVQYIAACTKTPTLTLMGRTFPARWGPLGSKDRFVAGHIPKDFSGNIFEEDYAGYDSLSVDKVEHEFNAFLEALQLKRP
jgi:ADP-heptose:LPS heptosyltransferase